MHADFSIAAKQARSQIAVPALDMGAIRARSQSFGIRTRMQRLGLSVAVALGVAGAAVALAANISQGVHVWFFGNRTVAVVKSFAQVRQPMAADVRALAAKTTFPLVLPAGVPSAAHVLWIAYDPVDKPNLVTIEYRDADGHPYMGVTLVDAAKIAADRTMMPGGPTAGVVSSKPAAHWQIGPEQVFVQTSHLSLLQIARMRSAMQTQTPAQTQADFAARLPRIAVQIAPADLRLSVVGDAAGRFAPPGENVLLGKWEIAQLPRIAAKGKPLYDGRTVYMTSVPQVNGAPDYRNAQLYWPKSIALPSAGVREVASRLRTAQVGPNCGCAILVNHSGNSYKVWKIDEKSLKDTPL
jgi:hypothetical protein